MITVKTSSHPTYLCHVSTEQGKITDPSDKLLVETLRNIAKMTDTKIIARGRHPDRKGLAGGDPKLHRRLRQDVPIDLSSEIILYSSSESYQSLPIMRSLVKSAVARQKKHA